VKSGEAAVENELLEFSHPPTTVGFDNCTAPAIQCLLF
jgi:hypothetical protein